MQQWMPVTSSRSVRWQVRLAAAHGASAVSAVIPQLMMFEVIR